ncbi:replicative DNA helicase [Nocardioides imazamoxiresistens]|uniref:replicative DNA helicase n=1 Tax=Nocardioides imazamoxiresistens TaxID=3231893 RepID=UPI003F68A70E
MTDRDTDFSAPPPDEWGDGPSPYEPGEAPPQRAGDRTPPQDNAAEQSVLGSMLLSKDAIADVVESVRGTDFYRPAHESVFDAIIDLYGRGEPADPVTVAAELQRRGELQKVGGAPYLHTLSANVPIAANAGYYAEIVREKSVLRRLVEAGTRIVHMGYAGEGEVDDIVDVAQAEVFKLAEKRSGEDYAPLADIMEGVLDEIEAIGNREAGVYGVPTGFADFDELTNGFHGGQMIVVAARPAMGKALALDTPLPTPSGWTTMGEVQVGDLLVDAAGRPTSVVAATDVLVGHACYEVELSDGSRVVADAGHQWVTQTRAPGEDGWAPATVTTEEMAATLHVGGRPNHAIVTSAPLVGEPADLPIGPYALGAWLGAGFETAARIRAGGPEVPLLVEAEGYEVVARGGGVHAVSVPQPEPVEGRCVSCGAEHRGLRAHCQGCWTRHGSFTALLRTAGLLGSRHVPAAYLRASEAQRRALLAGLLDTVGAVVEGGACRLPFADERMADGAHELVSSLGYAARRSTEHFSAGPDDDIVTVHDVVFTAADDVFRLERKHLEHKEHRPAPTAGVGRREVVAVRRVRSVPVRCVQVDNDEHLYLAGRSMVPTHNSTLALDFVRAASIHSNMTSVFFSLEMNRSEITMRLLSAEARVPLNHIRNGAMTDDDWAKLAKKMGEVSSAPVFIDDSPNMTMMEIRAKARRLKQKHDLRLIIIDYLQLMSSGKKVESRQIEVSEFSRQIKLLAKELDVPVIALSQLNRGSEQRADKRPMVSDLRESGSIEQDADMVLLLHRDDVYEKESTRPGEADLIIAKHRNGPTRDIVVAFQGHYSRFVDMAQ